MPEAYCLFVGVDLPMGKPMDLSNATNLKEVVFRSHLDPEWISSTLQTISQDHQDLRHITIRLFNLFYSVDSWVTDQVIFLHPEAGTILQNWLNLDCVLVRLQESHSIHVKLLYRAPAHVRGRNAKGYLAIMLPGVMTGERVEIGMDT